MLRAGVTPPKVPVTNASSASTSAVGGKSASRQAILRLCHEAGITCREADFPPAALVEAEEAFVTGTFGGVTPARSINGRALLVPGPVTARLRELYQQLLEEQ